MLRARRPTVAAALAPAGLAILAAIALPIAGSGCDGASSSGGTPPPLPAAVTAPPLRLVDPAPGATDLGPATVFRVELDGAIDAASVEGRVHLRDPSGEVPLRLHVDGAQGVLLVDPAEPLAAGTEHTLVLEAGLATRDGAVLARAVELPYRAAAPPSRTAGPEVVFEPLEGEFRPFPSDLFLVPDATRPSGRSLEIWNTHLPTFVGVGVDEEIDGFDPSGRLFVLLAGAIDPARLPTPEGSTDPRSPIQLRVADPASARFGEALAFRAELEQLGLSQDPPVHMLVLRPLFPLATGTSHALVVRRALVGADGWPARPSEELSGLLAGEPGGDGRVDDYGRTVRDVLDALAGVAPFGPEDVAGVSVFTTATDEALTTRMLELVDAVVRTAEVVPPRLLVESVEDLGDRVVVRGEITSWEFRDGEELDPARFATVPVAAPETRLEVLIVLPPGAAGAPAVIFGHGINSSKEQMLGIGRALAEAGIATVGIDDVEHGSRFTGAIIPALSFLSLDYVPGLRDNARQTVADLVQLGRLIRLDLGGMDVLPVGSPDGIPDVDGTRHGYLGISFGGILGSMYTAVEPDLAGAVLMVGGGTWTDVVFDFGVLRPGNIGFDLIDGLVDALGLPASGVLSLVGIAQQVIAPGDPLTYARHSLNDPFPSVGERRPLLTIEVVDDDTVPNGANEALARALGTPQLLPSPRPVAGITTQAYPARANGPGGVTVGHVLYQTYNDGRRATHNNIDGAPEVRAQAVEFLRDVLDGRTPTIRQVSEQPG